jgi:hypothetical protein
MAMVRGYNWEKKLGFMVIIPSGTLTYVAMKHGPFSSIIYRLKMMFPIVILSYQRVIVVTSQNIHEIYNPYSPI